VNELPDEENEKQKEWLDKAKPKIDFYKAFGRAISRSRPLDVASRWQGPACELLLTLSDKTVVMSGSYEHQANPFASALGLGGILSAATRLIKHEVTYEGELRGLTIDALISHKSDGPKSLLSEANFKTKALLVLADDLSTMSVMENPHSLVPSFYQLKAIRTPDQPQG